MKKDEKLTKIYENNPKRPIWQLPTLPPVHQRVLTWQSTGFNSNFPRRGVTCLCDRSGFMSVFCAFFLAIIGLLRF